MHRSNFAFYLQLPAYSLAQNISVQTEEVGIGYANPWREYSIDNRVHPWKTSPIVGMITVSILILSKTIIITVVTTYYNDVKELMKGKISPFYYFFWGCHCTTLGIFSIAYDIYVAKNQENKLIITLSYVTPLVVDMLTALTVIIIEVVLIFKKKIYIELLPVPLTAVCFKLCGTRCNSNPCSKAWVYALNIIAFFFTFFFISCLLQMVPNILVSFYAFPSRTLIHIAFFQVSFVCLVAAFGGLIFLLEKVSWLIHIKVHGIIPEELNSSALIIAHVKLLESQTSTNPVSNQSGVSSSTARLIQANQVAATGSRNRTTQQFEEQQSLASTEPFAEIEYSNKAELRYPVYTFCIMFLQILTAVFLVVALILIIIVVGAVVLTDSVDKDNLQSILTLLPAIIINAVIILTRKRFFNTNVALKYQLGKVVEDTHIETAENNHKEPNQRTSLL